MIVFHDRDDLNASRGTYPRGGVPERLTGDGSEGLMDAVRQDPGTCRL